MIKIKEKNNRFVSVAFKRIAVKLFVVALILSLNSLPLIQISYTLSYFNDTETSPNNVFTASSLDFSLNSINDFTPEVDGGTNALRNISILNNGSLGFLYNIKSINETGALCESLELSASLDGGSSITEPLSTFDIGPFNYNSPEDWNFEIKLTSDSPELDEEICKFDLEYFAWQKNFSGQLSVGFSDTEIISNTVIAKNLTNNYGSIADFAVFGAGDASDTNFTHTGNVVSISGGMIGSNRTVRVGNENTLLGVRAGANMNNTGGNTTVGGKGIVVNKEVVLGSSNIVNGDIHAGDVKTNSKVNINGDVVSGGSFLVAADTTVSLDVDAQSATLNTDSSILGTLTLPNGVLPSLSSGATVGVLNNDGVPPPALPQTFSTITLPTPNVFSVSTDAGKDLKITDGNSPLTLNPGIYRDLSSISDKTLNLSAGTYVFHSIDLGGSNTINADVSNGRILIFVESDVTFGNNLVFNLTGGSSNKVYLESGGEVKLGGDSQWHGTIYSTKSNEPNKFGVNIETFTNVWGALYSRQQVDIGGNSNINLVGPYFGTYIAPSSVSNVVLNEIYPNPSGGTAPNDREWIELYNDTSSSIDVLGWKISELSGATETFYSIVASGAVSGQIQPYNGASTIIPAGGLLVLEFSVTNRLNNTGDTVRLYDSTNLFVDGHAYPNTVSGKSHQRIPNGGIWVDPEPTPGETNKVSRQDLINAGLDQETIQIIINLLREKGETLIGEEILNDGVNENTEEDTTKTTEFNSEAIISVPDEEILEVVKNIASESDVITVPETEADIVVTSPEESELIIDDSTIETESVVDSGELINVDTQ